MSTRLNAITGANVSLDVENVVLRCKRREAVFLTPPWTMSFRRGDHVAILSSSRRMRDVFIGSLYGLVAPVSGSIVSHGTVSWPVGLKGGLDGKLTLIQNLRFLAGVYEELLAPLNVERFLQTFLDLAGLSSGQMLKDLKSKDQKMFFAIASLAFSFDTFLVPTAQFLQGGVKDKLVQCIKAVFEDRIENRCMITSTTNKDFQKQYCNKGIVIDEAGAMAFQGDLNECYGWLEAASDSVSKEEDDSVDESVFLEELSNEDRDPELLDII